MLPQESDSTAIDHFQAVEGFSSSQQKLLTRLIDQAVAAALLQAAATEVAHYASCFSQEVSKNEAAQTRRILKTASARFLCAQMASGALK